MKTSTRYVNDFDTIDWKKIVLDRESDCRKFYTHAAKRNDDDFKNFANKFKNKYETSLYYDKYCRLVATAVLMGL